MIVVDASVLAVALGDDGENGAAARARMQHEDLTAPELIDPEVTSVFRRHVAAALMTAERAESALADLIDLPLGRIPHRALLRRCWDLRDTLTVDDACYVALAEALDIPLLTSDSRLARAPRIRCDIELLR